MWVVRLFNSVMCAATAVSLLGFFEASVTHFSPSSFPPSWLDPVSMAAVRHHAQLYASLLSLFAINNACRLMRVRAVFVSTSMAALLTARSFLHLSVEAPVMVEPQLSQSLLVMSGVAALVNLVSAPWALNAVYFSFLSLVFLVVPLGASLVSLHAHELCRLQLGYAACACAAAVVLFCVQRPFVAPAVLFGLSCLNAVRVALFVARCAEPHMALSSALATAATLGAGCLVNVVAAVMARRAKRRPSKTKRD